MAKPWGVDVVHIMKTAMERICSLLVMAVCFCGTLSARSAHYKEIADSLSERLIFASSAADSLELLTDIFDLRPKSMGDSIGEIILHTALCSDNDRVGLDIIRNLANMHVRNDSILGVYLKKTALFEPSDDRAQTATFIRMMRNLHNVRYSTAAEKDRRLRQLLRKVSMGMDENLYDDIVTLHGICLYVAECSQGELLSKYMTLLGNKIKLLPPGAYAIKNCYYVQAAMSFRENDENVKSIEADHLLLESIDELENGDMGMKRHYRSYDGNRYIVYTRLLSNYPKLSAKEVEEYYRKAMRMVASDSLAAVTNRISKRPQIYYSMYKKDYAGALELLKEYIDVPYNASVRRMLLRMMVKSAEETGDIDALLTASREYNEILEETIENRTREKYKELQIIYDINQLKAEHARESNMMQRNVMVIAITASVVLLVLLTVMLVLFRHARKLARSLSVANDALVSESANLRQAQADLVKARDEAQLANRIKSDFIKNMSGEVAVPLHIINEYTNLIIDCSEAGFKPYLKHFADLVSHNAELLSAIVNDVLNLSEIDSDSVSVNMKKEPLAQLCELAIESVRHRVHPGVEIHLAPGIQDVTVYTDSRRLMQIMVQLLSNSAKFTKSGSIVVDFHADEDAGKAYIYVTDTGIGVSPGNSDRIFERFVKLDRSSQGIGIGLPIARHLACLLGGSVTFDAGYTDGARFIVAVPLG